MDSSLPFALRVAAGVIAESIDTVRRLPAEISTLPVSVVGRLAKLSFQLNQQLTDLATAGDRLLAGLTGEQPPERTAWATIDDEAEVAAGDPQAAPTWDSVADAREDAVDDDAAVADVTPITSRANRLTRDLIEDIELLEEDPTQPGLRSANHQAAPDGAATPPATRPAPRPAATRQAGLTLAQLRSKVRTMSTAELRDALATEERGRARPAHLTLLTNRLATLEHAE